MLEPYDRVVVGVSGGADSVCLFLLLLSYREKIPLSLAAVHVNHGIRSGAGEDARYVEELCGRYGVPFFLKKADVRGYAREMGYSEEDAGRRVRYEAFYETAGQMGGARIAVAHNSNDNAETMLFHLFRGSGLKGLGGIAPVRGQIIRPILCLERREVETYLESRGQRWCSDITNEGDDYRRNRIRHHILPYAQEQVAGRAVAHMGHTGELLRETEDYLEEQTREALGKCAGGDGETGWRIRVEDFLGFHRVLQKRMLFALLNGLSLTGKDISEIHIRDTAGLFERPGNRTITLPFGILARREYGTVVLERRGRTEGMGEGCLGMEGAPAREAEGKSLEAPCREAERENHAPVGPDLNGRQVIRAALGDKIFQAPLVYDLGDWGRMEFMGFSIKKGWKVPAKRYTKWFDYDKIEECVVIRSRRQGDFLTIADRMGNTVHKSLKDYMITEKIPRQMRDRIPLLAAGNHVIWLPGWRISEAFKVDGNTERILRVRLLEEKFCSGSETEEENGGTH